MSAPRTFAIVGANLAGGRAAETLRARGFDGRIVLIGAEPERPYERPPLSKERLRGKKHDEELFLRPQAYYADQAIELRLGMPVERMNVREHTLTLADGETLRYDRALVASGSALRRLRVPGGELPGVHYLRTMREAASLAKALAKRPRVLVVGAGFIGCEVAASARILGCNVTMIDIATPLARALGEQMGAWVAGVHRAHGVTLHIGVGLQEFCGAAKLEAARLTDGREVACDIAVVGVGVAPATDFLDGNAVMMENGIVVDEYCRTSAPDVYAAGDVANWFHPTWGERLRVEHFDHAQNHGVAAAKSMLDAGEAYAPVPFFWSDQYDLTLQYVGHAAHWDELVVRGSLESGSFSAFYLDGGRLYACLAVNRFRDLSAARRLLQERPAVDRTLLADESTDLKTLDASKA